MRILIVSVLLSMGMIFVPAAINAGCPCGEASPQSYYNYSGPACFGPPGFYLAPGCCECPPSACDNAWAGYCEQKARWQAFWAGVGMPHPPRGVCLYGRTISTCAACPVRDSAVEVEKPSPQSVSPTSPAASPAKPLLPVPGLPPERSSRRSYFPWTRR